MPTFPLDTEYQRRIAVLKDCLTEGMVPPGAGPAQGMPRAMPVAAARLGIAYESLKKWAQYHKLDWASLVPKARPQTPGIGHNGGPALGDPADDYKLLKLQDEVKRLKAELAKAQRGGLEDHLIRETILGLKSSDTSPPDWTIDFDRQPGAQPLVPIQPWTDWHLGEVVNLAETGGINEFNLSIAETRVRRLIERSIRLIDLAQSPEGREAPGIIVPLGGDFLSGQLHAELAETNEVTDQQAIIEAVRLITWGLRQYADRFGRVFCPATVGNHGRTTRRPEMKRFTFKNLDWLVYQLVQTTLQAMGDDRISFLIPATGEARFKVYGWPYLLTHGDRMGVKGGDGLIGAIGPITRGGIKLVGQYSRIGEEIRTTIIGHWHQTLWLPGMFVCNTLKGWDEYARVGLRVAPSLPQQSLWFHHPDHGPVSKAEVFLEDAKPAKSDVWLEAA